VRVRWLLSRLRREPFTAWPRRVVDALPRPPRRPPRLPDARWPWALAAPDAPPHVPVVPGDLRAGWSAARAQVAAWSALRGAPPPPLPSARPAQAHEAAFRLVSLALIAGARPSAALTTDLHALADGIADGRSRGTSALNHAVGERAALALAAVMLPDSPRVGRFRAAALELPALLDAQLAGTDTGIEESLAYHLQNLEWGLLAWRCGVPGLEAALARGATAAADHLAGDGTLPDVGDDDGGCVFPSALPDRERLGAVLQALRMAVPEGYVPGLVAGLLALPPVAGVRPPAARTGRSTTVLRRGAHALVFDHGPLGAPPLRGHGHADALAVWWAPDGGGWAVGGRGTHQYTADPNDRRFRRGASAAATVVVDGRDPSEPHEHPFLWRSVADAEPVAIDLAAHTATGRVRTRVGAHTRTVTLAADGSVVLRDRLDGSGRHHVALGFPLRPGVRVGLTPDPALRVSAATEGHALRYGTLVPATTLRCEGVVSLPATFTTVLRPASPSAEV
jgi:hypothetical protein